MHHERMKVINHAGDRPSNTHLPGYKDFKSNYMCVQKTLDAHSRPPGTQLKVHTCLP